MRSNLTRRSAMALLASLGALAGLGGVPRAAEAALNERRASALVDKLVAEIQKTVNSGKTGNALYRDFERIFATYADMPIIAQSVLGPDWRSASPAQRRAFTDAFAIYVSRKYGRQFRDFIGGRVEVKSARPVRNYYEVRSVAYLRGQSPFDVVFMVTDRSGSDRIFNLVVEGVNMNITERTEIGAMLDRQRGDLDALITQLRRTT